MKTIYLVKHSGSREIGVKLNDLRRPLSPEGHSIAIEMAKRLSNRDIRPDLIITSHAQSAIESAEVLAEELELPRSEIEVREEFYSEGMDEMIEVLRQVSDEWNTLMIFGSKPAFTDIAGFLSGDGMDEYTEGCIVCIEVNVDSWKNIDESKGEIKFVIDPEDEPPEVHSDDMLQPDY